MIDLKIGADDRGDYGDYWAPVTTNGRSGSSEGERALPKRRRATTDHDMCRPRRTSLRPGSLAPGMSLAGSLAACSRRLLLPGGCGKVLRCLSASSVAGRINAWRSPDELDHLLKLGSAELSDDLFNASLMQQQNGGDDGLGHALCGGPTHIV
jgi:hypothetical protein